MNKIGLYFVCLICLSSCFVQNLNRDLNNRFYSTGHMGMPGEYGFIFSDDSLFYYSQTVPGIYSEGYYKWISDDSIRFESRQINPYSSAMNCVYNSISGKIAVLKGKKLYFNGFTYFLKERRKNSQPTKVHRK
ncbi:hypothetical protein [Sphingobacterium daejeonense]|uniref:hypothetical protein n=1 Tax=Sphingobacterium daejeonense TaxID=371142 RepID=UPI0010C2AA4F|nr:hypothetical protein [Sphingobacterium daejeonense]VTP96482.1 Uncharacterised protein [Sphingobacterium daejeonense]